MKRLISFVMCICLLVGLMPAAVMAEGESALPEGYAQMYRGNNVVAFGEAGNTPSLRLYINTDEEALDPADYSFSTINDNGADIGEVNKEIFNEETILRWFVGAIPGHKGYIVAEEINGNGKYAIRAEVGPAEFGVYTAIDANVSAPGDSYVIPDGTNYVIDFSNNGPKTVYIIPGYEYPRIISVESSNAETISASLSGGIVTASLADVDSGTFTTEISLSVIFEENGTPESRSMYIQFINEGEEDDDIQLSPGIYTELNNGKLGGYIQWTDPYIVPYDGGEECIVYFYAPNSVSFILEAEGVSVSETAFDGIYKVTLASGHTGNIDGGFEFRDANGNGGGGMICFTGGSSGGNQNNGIGELISGVHATQPSDLFDVTKGMPSRDVEDAVSQFTYNGEIYYFGVGSEGIPFFSSAGSMGISMVPNQYIYSKYGITFYVKEGDGYKRIENAALTQELFAQFTNLNLKVWVIDYTDPGIKLTASETFPAIYSATINDCFINCVAMEIGLEHKGDYIITASGNYKGDILSSHTYSTWDPRYEVVFEYDETSQFDYISQVNAFLNNVTVDAAASVIVDMPEGIYTGYIMIPARLGDMDVSIWGSTNQSTGELLTTINGGIICSGRHGTAFNINFVGAGKENVEWPADSVNAGQKNYAFMGSGDIRPRQCRIANFNIALYGEEMHKNSRGSMFINNGTAIYFGERESTGDPIFENNAFIGNDTAINFSYMPEDIPTSIFDFKQCVFIDNKTDIHNGLQRNIFIPGCYFAETDSEGNETPRKCIYSPIGNQQGEGGGNPRKQVLFYPQARTNRFNDFIYETNTDFYGGKNPIVSINFTAIFPIPAGALDGVTLDVMKHDELLARIDFSSNTYGGTSSGGSFSPYALRRSGSSSEASFDATVDVQRSDDGNTITLILNDIPGGKTPTVSVPCDETWLKAEVCDENGNDIESVVADGFVSFIAPHGGSYTIRKHIHSPADAVRENEVAATYDKEGSYDEVIYCSACGDELSRETKPIDKLPAPPVIPSVPSIPSVPDKEVVINPDGSVTTTVTTTVTDKDGNITETTETPDGIIGTVVTDAEGVITELKAEIPAGADTEKAILLPIEVLAEDEQTISINTNTEDTVCVAVSVADADLGTVAVIVNEDGSESIIQTTALTQEGIEFSISGNAEIKIIDNSKNFDDVICGAWYDDAIKFASAREFLIGTGENAFSPATASTRAMVWTLLARLEGVDIPEDESWYASAQSWAVSKGISDGTNPDGEVTREQLVTMLWRYFGKPASDYDLSGFTDHGETSDWAIGAKKWAVETGLIQSMGNNKLDPGGNTSRAQLAQILLNLLNN